MTLRELFELLQDAYVGSERDMAGRTVKVAVGGKTGSDVRLDWRYGDLVLVADKADEPNKPNKPKAGRGTGNGD